MIQCKRCGFQMQDPKAKFCPRCGLPVPGAQKQPPQRKTTPQAKPSQPSAEPAQPAQSRQTEPPKQTTQQPAQPAQQNTGKTPRKPAAKPARQPRRKSPYKNYEGDLYRSPYGWLKWAVAAVAVVVLAVGGLIGWQAVQTGLWEPSSFVWEDQEETAPSGTGTQATPRPDDAGEPADDEQPLEEEAEVTLPLVTPEPLEVATPAPVTTPQPVSDGGTTEMITLPGGGTAPAADFYFPYSSTQAITYDDLDAMFGALPADEAYQASQLALNEIYARYGYNFHPEKSVSANIAYQYFHTLGWYDAIYADNTASSLDQVSVTDMEQQNIETIAAWQTERGYR